MYTLINWLREIKTVCMCHQQRWSNTILPFQVCFKEKFTPIERLDKDGTKVIMIFSINLSCICSKCNSWYLGLSILKRSYILEKITKTYGFAVVILKIQNLWQNRNGPSMKACLTIWCQIEKQMKYKRWTYSKMKPKKRLEHIIRILFSKIEEKTQ